MGNIPDSKLTKLAKKILRLINEIIPKNSNLWIFVSIPDYSDNARILFEYMKKKSLQIRKVWLCYDKKLAKKLQDKGIEACHYFSIKGVWNFLRAKVIITTHNDYITLKSRGQYYVGLWHGLPIKLDGVWTKKNQRNIPPDFLIVPSRFAKVIYSSIFGVPPQNILELGIPRTDVLFINKNNNKLKTKLKKQLNLPLDKKIVLYAPTWRDWDTNSRFIIKLFLKLIGNKELQKILNTNNAILVFKPHHEDEINVLSYDYKLPENFRIVTSNDMLKKELTTNELLLITDLLITDYSSIFWDYLILDRPIIFYVPDIDDYRAYRGLILEPFEEWVPGRVVYSLDALVETISDILKEGKDGFEYKRKWLRNIMYKHQDGRSSERIIRYLLHISKGEV